MNHKYSSISIIYNPNSTGDSKTMAEDLQQKLRAGLKDIRVMCIPTEYAGHASELASEIARSEKNPLIISSSGDGGYNEVVNGVMRAGNENAVAAVLPAGNANDHSRTMQKRPLADAIIKGEPTRLDLLKVTIKSPDTVATVLYAHSYAGLGLTPVVATELNRHDLNSFNEMVLALKTFRKFKPFKIRHNDSEIKLDSLLFGNINQMAKVLTLAPKNKPDDGKFEVVLFKSTTKLELIKKIAQAAVSNLNANKRVKKYSFLVIKPMPMQLDGEVVKLKKDTKVTVESAHNALLTII